MSLKALREIRVSKSLADEADQETHREAKIHAHSGMRKLNLMIADPCSRHKVSIYPI